MEDINNCRGDRETDVALRHGNALPQRFLVVLVSISQETVESFCCHANGFADAEATALARYRHHQVLAITRWRKHLDN
jgi:hypothetical protein